MFRILLEWLRALKNLLYWFLFFKRKRLLKKQLNEEAIASFKKHVSFIKAKACPHPRRVVISEPYPESETKHESTPTHDSSSDAFGFSE